MKTFTFMCCFVMAAAFVQGQVIHVPDDYDSIQLAIDAALPGDTVLVADGTYYEQINFLGKKPLMVASEFLLDGDESHIANTIIDGSQITSGDSCSIVYFISGEDTTSILCGFTIQHGKGTIYTVPQTEIKGGGGIFVAGSGAKIIHNHITNNHLGFTLQSYPPVTTGAGIHTKFENSDSLWIIITENRIDDNSCKSNLTEASGAGISICSNSKITGNILSNNTIIGTGNAFAGGAAFLCGSTISDWSSTATAIVEKNVITHNFAKAENNFAHSAGGLFVAVSAKLENNFIAHNFVETYSPYWGGCGGVLAYCPNEGTVLRGNTFWANKSNANGGALGFESVSDFFEVLVENNYFIENEAVFGGALCSFSNPINLQNNVFAGNHALTSGGAIYSKNLLSPSEHMVKIINNSISDNIANTAGGAIFSIGDMPLVINSIFWNDSCAEGYGREIHLNGLYDTVEISHSDIDLNLINRGVRDGGGNISIDPEFDNLDSLNLLPSSQCLNIGTDSYTCACGDIHISPAYDIIGIPRPQSGTFEMGAYEVLIVDVPEVVSHESSVVTYPNPLSGFTTFEYELEQSANVSLVVYNHLGQQVAILVNGPQLAGKHQLRWNAEGMPSGIYYYRLTTNDYRLTTGKLVLVR